MVKKIVAFVAALAVSATAVGTLAVTAADDWHEYLHSSAIFKAVDYDGLIQLSSQSGSTTMKVGPSHKGNYKYLDLSAYSYNPNTQTYTEIPSYASTVEGTAEILATAVKSTSNVDYICSIGTVCNTTDPNAGTYQLIASHIRKYANYADPKPLIKYSRVYD